MLVAVENFQIGDLLLEFSGVANDLVDEVDSVNVVYKEVYIFYTFDTNHFVDQVGEDYYLVF